MSRGRLLLVLTVLAGLTLATGSHSALGAITVVQRPTTGGSYAYATPEAPPHVGARADVHYVTNGPDAPPLNDDDGNGRPDYVEEVSRAADAALEFYARYGFKTPGPDTGGPDAKPDIYIGTLPAGTFGLTFASAFAEGGTFVIVSPRLDPTEPQAFAGVRTTVAHELAHVIQFSYVGSGRLPLWAAEGSAVALSMLVTPGVQDLVATQYLDAWLGSPWLPLYDERFSCSHCYGGAWWWLYLSGPEPAHAAELLRQARDRRPRGQEVDTHRRLPARRSAADEPRGLTGHRLREVLARLYRRGLRLGSALTLNASTRTHATRALGVSRRTTSRFTCPLVLAAWSSVPFGTARRRAWR